MRLRTHQRAPPVRRSAGEMRHATRAPDAPDDRPPIRRRSKARMIPRPGRRAEKSAGRHSGAYRKTCPNDTAALVFRHVDWRRQAGEIVHDHLRRARGAGSEKDPLGGTMLDGRGLRRREDRTAADAQCTLARIHFVVAYNRVHLRLGHREGKVFGQDVGRADDDAVRYAIQLNQRHGGGQLIAHCQ